MGTTTEMIHLSVSLHIIPNSPDNFRFPTRLHILRKNQTEARSIITGHSSLNFRDLDLIGEIVHHCVSNGELITWQKSDHSSASISIQMGFDFADNIKL